MEAALLSRRLRLMLQVCVGWGLGMFIGGRVGDLRARTETTSGLYTACFELGGPRPTVGVPEGELAEVLRDGMRRTILWGIQARQVVPRTWVRSSLTRLITERLRPD